MIEIVFFAMVMTRRLTEMRCRQLQCFLFSIRLVESTRIPGSERDRGPASLPCLHPSKWKQKADGDESVLCTDGDGGIPFDWLSAEGLERSRPRSD